MRIAVNTRLLLKDRLDGIGWFSYETLKRITRNNPDHEFIFFFDRPYGDEFIFADNITPVVQGPPARHPFLWYLWFEWLIPYLLRKHRADVFLSPDGYMPLRSPVPCVPVIHDINFLHRPADLPFFTRHYYNFFFPRFARKAELVGTVSNFSADDIADSYGVGRTKLKVLHNGANDAYKPLKKEQIAGVRQELTGGKPYFIFIGTLHPRKNVANLLRAFEIFRKMCTQEFRLVIVGEKMFRTREIEQAYSKMKFRDDVIFTGRLNPEELHQTLGAAFALTFVPFYEGFGIPLLEAMKCGVPAIASRATSLPEVGKDAVLYCDPSAPGDIARAMLELSVDTDLQKELRKKGLQRAKDFSWDQTAENLWNAVLQAGNNHA